jgi:hypothetical protein
MTPNLCAAPAGQTNQARRTSMKNRFATKKPPKSPAALLRGLLLNAAMLAVSRGMATEAFAIREVLIGLGIDKKQLGMAMALVQLQRGELDACLLLLEQEVLVQEPGYELALAVQSRVWQLQGLPKGRTQANAVLVSSTDPVAREMARARF